MAESTSSSMSVEASFFEDPESGRSSRLHIGGIPYTELISQYGSPLYVYDAQTLQRNFEMVRSAFGERIGILYALKANPNIAIAQVLRSVGSGAEVASGGEIQAALAAGFQGRSIQFAGPGKTTTEIELGIETGLGCFNVESAAEYQEVAAASLRLGLKPKMAIRVNPAAGGVGARMRMSGGAKKFGVDADQVVDLAKVIVEGDAAELVGLHTYGGTQNFNAGAWAEAASQLVALAGTIEDEVSLPMNSLNFGGGFGVPYYQGDPTFDIAEAGAAVLDLIESENRGDRRYFVELGRYLVATAGVYLTRVTYVKDSGGCRHVILDGGMHQHSAAAGVGSIMKRSFPIVACEASDASEKGLFSVGGPLCTPADEFASDLRLPSAEAGDVLAILNSGAYGLTFSNTMFLSHPTPAEVLVDSGSSYLIRARGTDEDALRGQYLAPRK